jgi:hypothetical protein
VPKGVTNVAIHKPVTASDPAPTLGELKQVTDGDKDGLEGSYVEIGPGKQYFQIDLQQPYEIFAIVVWHYHAQPRVYHDVIVQLSPDASFATQVRTVYNNDYDNSSGFGVGRNKEYIDTHEGLLIDTQGAQARYVRLYGNGNTESDLNHCTEIEVYGRERGELRVAGCEIRETRKPNLKSEIPNPTQIQNSKHQAPKRESAPTTRKVPRCLSKHDAVFCGTQLWAAQGSPSWPRAVLREVMQRTRS